MTPTLYTLYRIEDFDQEWFSYLYNRPRQYSLPTEIVVREPQYVVPRMGRIFQTNLLCSILPETGQVIVVKKSGTIDRIMREKQSFSQEDVGEPIFLVEFYTDHGDDGHTCMELEGFAFVVKSDLETEQWYGITRFKFEGKVEY